MPKNEQALPPPRPPNRPQPPLAQSINSRNQAFEQPPQPQSNPHQPHKRSTGWTSKIVLLLVIAGAAGWWYQKRESNHTEATKTEESSLLSGEGKLLIEARPWGRIEKVIDTASGEAVTLPEGSKFTPRMTSLPLGNYEITMTYLDIGSQSCQVEIQADTRETCKVRFVETDPHAYFREHGWR